MSALPLMYVRETMRPLPTEALAGLPDFLRGVCIIRGIPTPVIDLASVLGNPHARPPTRFVTLCLEQRQAALSVDGILRIANLDRELFGELPSLLRDTRPELIEAMGTLDGELLVVLKASHLVPEEAWRTLEIRGCNS